jgi:NaMN:DMB phosphoribosyltransferase
MATTKALELGQLLSGTPYSVDTVSAYTTTTTSNEVITSFAMSAFNTCLYTIQATFDIYVHVINLTVTHNTLEPSIVRFNEIVIDSPLITNVTATPNGSNIDISLNSAKVGTMVTTLRKAIKTTSQSVPYGDLEAAVGTLDLDSESGVEDLNV